MKSIYERLACHNPNVKGRLWFVFKMNIDLGTTSKHHQHRANPHCGISPWFSLFSVPSGCGTPCVCALGLMESAALAGIPRKAVPPHRIAHTIFSRGLIHYFKKISSIILLAIFIGVSVGKNKKRVTRW